MAGKRSDESGCPVGEGALRDHLCGNHVTKEDAVLKKFLIVAGVAVMASGCATTQATQNETMVTQLQFRVGDLERKLENREEQIKELSYQVKDLTFEVSRLKDSSKRTSMVRTTTSAKTTSSGAEDDRIIRVEASEKDVQTALKNAGYYTGTIDGRIGSGTKSAIVQFQTDNNLKADGIIGGQTWTELKKFLR